MSEVPSDVLGYFSVALNFLDQRERLMYISDLQYSFAPNRASHLSEHVFSVDQDELESAVDMDVGRLAADQLHVGLVLNLCVTNSTGLAGLGVDLDLGCHELIPGILVLLGVCGLINGLRALLEEGESRECVIKLWLIVVRNAWKMRLIEHQTLKRKSVNVKQLGMAPSALKCGCEWLLSSYGG